jgi:hypothetical protein
MKRSIMYMVPVKGSNLILRKTMLRIKCRAETRRSNVATTMNGARNDLSFLCNPIITNIDESTPKHDVPQYIKLNHNVTVNLN